MKIGDLVSVIDDDLKGKISAFKENLVQIEDEHGFHYDIEKSKVVLYNHNIYDDISITAKKETSTKISKKNQTQPQSIDLHFEKLVNNPQDFESWERLMIQREKLIEKLEYCRSNNMKKLNIIHGIGDGVLQNMVHEVLQGFAGIEYEDHDFFYHSTGNALVTFL
ncbi:DNA mismatch repair protein [Cloacibacterium normanense]|uniref:DNA mismatch repair protein n=1 Tax=Cloacibacterium normanense TaxID=237258 RepID=A0A2S7I249_9FLAO|nr:Smr/MutS family protein [Cloacibacterium normanense]PPZ90662.1 DNA mismatch repair protein [Cloacibacterium normanense]